MRTANTLEGESIETITDRKVREAYELLKKYGKTPVSWLEERFGEGVVDKLRSLGLATVMIENNIVYAIPDVNERIAFKLLYKIWFYHKDAYMSRRGLTKDELAILPVLRSYGFINYDNDAVWLLLDGYAYICDIEKLYPSLANELEREVDEKYAKNRAKNRENLL